MMSLPGMGQFPMMGGMGGGAPMIVTQNGQLIPAGQMMPQGLGGGSISIPGAGGQQGVIMMPMMGQPGQPGQPGQTGQPGQSGQNSQPQQSSSTASSQNGQPQPGMQGISAMLGGPGGMPMGIMMQGGQGGQGGPGGIQSIMMPPNMAGMLAGGQPGQGQGPQIGIINPNPSSNQTASSNGAPQGIPGLNPSQFGSNPMGFMMPTQNNQKPENKPNGN